MKHKYNITEAYMEFFFFKFNKIREVQGISNEHLKKKTYCNWNYYTGQQNLTLFSSHELQQVNLAVLFTLNSDMYTEFFYQAGFQRYRRI